MTKVSNKTFAVKFDTTITKCGVKLAFKKIIFHKICDFQKPIYRLVITKLESKCNI